MGLREQLNQKPALAGGIVGGVLLLVIVWVVMSMGGGGGAAEGGAITQDYYSDDDGASFFADAAFPQRVPPFTHNGKKAYKAYVFTCDGGKTKFVGALLRLSDAADKVIRPLADAKKFDDPKIAQVAEAQVGTEVKAPKTGDTGWLKFETPGASRLINTPACQGGPGPAVAVMPE